MRIDPVQLSSLIGDIYECALEPSRWNDTLTRFVSVFSPPDWDVAALMWEGINRPGVRWVGTTGLVAHALQGYEMVFAGTNVWSTKTGGLPLGEVLDTDALVTREELLKSDFYQKYLKTWGLELALFVIFERAGQEQLALAMPGPPNRPMEHLRRGLRLIAPHVQRTIRISHGIAAANLRTAGAEAALNLGHVGIIAVDANMGIVSCTERANQLASTTMYTLQNKRLIFADAAAQKLLVSLAERETPSSEAFRIEAADGTRHAVLAMNIRPQHQPVLGGWMEGARLLVSISLPHQAPLIEVDRLKAWFDLTPAEARLVAALANGKSTTDYASERGVTIDAIRFLLKSVFSKTGAKSQSQLMTMVTQLPQA
ncbi:MAG: helix-turn-helix transcriptional regulator [Alphaproteobacteria bacterium]